MQQQERQPLAIVYRDPRTLKAAADNARTHDDTQVAQLVRSIGEFGWTNPVLIDEDGGLIAGHGRIAAALRLGLPEVPTITLAGLTAAQKDAYLIADNQLPMNAGWDFDMLAHKLDTLRDVGFDLSLIGFTPQQLNDMIGTANQPPVSDAEKDKTPDVQAVEVSRLGDVWLCGRHRVMCGDSTNHAHVTALLAGRIAHLVHADPPYGMGKEADGVANDNLYGAKLDAFQMAWWQAFRPHVAANGSAYIWGNAPDLWRLWFVGGLAASEPLTIRNEIVWDKKSIAGMASPELTQYPEASERCLFFQIGRYVLQINQTKADYWPGWDSIRLWLCEQRDAAGFKAADVRRICGNHMYGHWFTTSQWSFISADNYAKLAAAAAGKAFARDYADLRAEYERVLAVFNSEVGDDLRSEFRAARPYFDNAHDTMRDSWEFPRVLGEERFGHATPKPVAMIERCIKSSTRSGELVAEPFGGTGCTLIAAEVTGRDSASMELQPAYVDVMVRRWQQLTGAAATREADGVEFNAAAAAANGDAVGRAA